jgi:hypothetical protein
MDKLCNWKIFVPNKRTNRRRIKKDKTKANNLTKRGDPKFECNSKHRIHFIPPDKTGWNRKRGHTKG